MIRTKYGHLVDEIGEILDATVTPSTELATLGTWDSLTAVLIVALIDDVTGHSVDGQKIAQCVTVGDVLALAEVAP